MKKADFFPDTNSLYIELSPNPSVESEEVFNGIVVDYDAQGKPVGIDIDDIDRIEGLSAKFKEALDIITKKVPIHI